MSLFIKKILFLSLTLSLIAGCTLPASTPAARLTGTPTIAFPTETRTPLPPTAEPSPTITSAPTAANTPAPSPTPTPAVLIGAGDVGFCGSEPPYDGDEKTALLIESLLKQHPNATVFSAGDTVYGDGTMVELKKCFEPSWGRFKDRIRPALGNHDYMTDQASPYYAYFGAAAGEPGLGYYSYDLGDWHIIVLNSNCDDIACGPNSKQVQWLRENLQNNGKQCTLAYWHHPRFSSGIAGNYGSVSSFWRAAYELGTEVVVSGHDHNYERFAPMDAEGNPDTNGVRQFVAGTGGAVLRDLGTPKPNSEVRYSGTNGVLMFKLYPGRYEWHFIPVGDSAQTDSGVGECH